MKSVKNPDIIKLPFFPSNQIWALSNLWTLYVNYLKSCLTCSTQPSGKFFNSKHLPVWNLRFFSNTLAFTVAFKSRRVGTAAGGLWPPSLAPSQYDDSGELDPEAVLAPDVEAVLLALSTAFNTSLAQWSWPTEADTPRPATGWSPPFAEGSAVGSWPPVEGWNRE